MRPASLCAIVALALLGAALGNPADERASNFMALQENVTALWQEVESLKEQLKDHIQGVDQVTSFSSDHHEHGYYYGGGGLAHGHHFHNDLGESPHHHDHGPDHHDHEHPDGPSGEGQGHGGHHDHGHGDYDPHTNYTDGDYHQHGHGDYHDHGHHGVYPAYGLGDHGHHDEYHGHGDHGHGDHGHGDHGHGDHGHGEYHGHGDHGHGDHGHGDYHGHDEYHGHGDHGHHGEYHGHGDHGHLGDYHDHGHGDHGNPNPHDQGHDHPDHHAGPYEGDHDHPPHHDGSEENHDHEEEEEDDDETEARKAPMVKCKKCRMKKKMMMMRMNEQPSHGAQGHHHHHHGSESGHPAVLEAHCHLHPNVEVPESNVSGHVTITQRSDLMGPLYFNIEIEGLPVGEGQLGSVHGFHIHENPVSEQKCSTAGPHFNPTGSLHGALTDPIRHVGDLGNIRSDADGKLKNYIITDSVSQFIGSHSIIGRSIVVHELPDDLGRGGDEGSQTTGNAGSRLACCVIRGENFPPRKTMIRFNG